MRWAEYVVRTKGKEVHTESWRENMKEGDHLEDLLVDGMKIIIIINNNIFKKRDGRT
jgi:hypothetical protein